MRKTNKIIAMLLALSTIGSFVACNGQTAPHGVGGSGGSEGKTMLFVGAYGGGLGTAWLDEVARNFEEFYKDQSFEKGKVGVDVQVHGNKDLSGDNLLNSMSASPYDVFFTENVRYFDHVGLGNFVDISDIVAEDLTAYGENESIEDKMSEEWKDFLTAKDGKYYGIPFYDGIISFIYDKDTFAEKLLYLTEEGNFITGDPAVTGEVLSKGPDGKTGVIDGIDYSKDDGMPATYDEFDKLLKQMRGPAGMTPLCCMNGDGYVGSVMNNFYATYEGAEQVKINQTFKGKANIVTSINNGVPVIEQKDITKENGYELQAQAGKYYAIKFLKEVILGNPANYEISSANHIESQSKFLIGGLSDQKTTYGFLADGLWWENEATAAFANYEAMYPGEADKQYRNFALMPVPKVSADKIGEKTTYLARGGSYAFINAHTGQLPLAKLFLKFAHTDESMSVFTRVTSMSKPLEYEVSEEEYNKMSTYAQSVVDMKKTADIVYPISAEKMFINNETALRGNNWDWRTKIGTTTYSNLYATFRDNKSISVEQYFNGLKSYHIGVWGNLNVD